MSDTVVRVDTLIELQDLLDTHHRVVVDFWAEWCGPCKRFAPHFQAAAEQIDATFVKVDIDKAPDVREAYQIQSVPTVLLFENGNIVSVNGRTAVQIVNELGRV